MRDNANKQIATWLYCGAVCIFIQILLGGITRLSGSGLSITEWRPLLGFLPPLNEAEWQHSFDQYKHIAQFKRVNAHFTLSDYQAIFFWEWFHRNWARFIGLVFIFPLVFFLVTKKIKATLLFSLISLFLLGTLQAAIGWIMVKSGLNDSCIAVNEVKLAIHFITACLLLAAILWLAFKLSIPPRLAIYSYKLKGISAILLGLLLLQLCYGALMAGSKAALAAPTWPDINGYLIPPEILSSLSDAGQSHLLTVQLIHRSLAYLIAILVFVLYKNVLMFFKMQPVSKTHQLSPLLYHTPPALVLLQIILGVITLLNSFNSSYWMYALLHQCVGLVLFSIILYIFYLCHKKIIC